MAARKRKTPLIGRIQTEKKLVASLRRDPSVPGVEPQHAVDDGRTYYSEDAERLGAVAAKLEEFEEDFAAEMDAILVYFYRRMEGLRDELR